MTPNEPDLDALLSHVDGSRRLAEKLVRDPQGADDVTQDALLTGMQRPPPDSRGWRGWLAGIVRNKARESKRAAVRRVRHEQAALRPDAAPSTAELAVRVEAQKRLLDAVMTLPDAYRTVVWRRFFENQPPRVIARELEVPVETVRTRLKRALHQLRLALDEKHDGNRRAWQVALLPVPALRPAPWLPATIGGAVMSAKTQWIAGAAIVLVALTTCWWFGVFDGSASDAHDAVDERAMLEGDDAAGETGLTGRGDGSALEHEPASAVRIPAPVDLATVDRDRDLHGIVVGPDGTPVAGARLQVVRFPWRYADLITDGGHNEEETGELGWSASDGTFSIRLARGDFVHLRVTAEGFAQTEMAQVQAGERLRVRLHAGVELTVTVRAPDGSPADDVPVELFRGGHKGDSALRRLGTTDADGDVVFTGLPPGISATLDVHVTREGWGNPGWVEVITPGSAKGSFELTLPEGRTLTGRVTDAYTGKPIENARVGVNWVLEPEVRTDANGRYVLPGWSGKHVMDIHVLAEGYGRAFANVGRRSEIDFELKRGNRVVGRILGHDGAPVDRVRVAAIGSQFHNDDQQTSLDSTRTGADGRFELDGLRRDMPHTLIVRARGHARMLFDFDASTEDVIDLGDLKLPRPCELIGRVLESDGTPAARVGVSLMGANEDRASMRRSGEPAQTSYGQTVERRTDDLGRFRFVDVPPGAYQLASRTGTRPGASARVELVEGKTTEKDLTYEGGRSVSVRVKDEDGKPVAGAFVIATDATGRLNVSGQVDGHGGLELVLPAETVTVRVLMLGDNPYQRASGVDVDPNTDEVTITMRKAAYITGVIVQPGGSPIAGAMLEARRGDDVLANATSNELGKFSFALPPDSVVDLVFEGMAWQKTNMGSQPVNVPFAGRLEGVRVGTKDVRVVTKRLAEDKSLSVLVLDPDGNPVKTAYIILNPALPGAGVLQTGADGRVTIEKIPALERTLTISYAGNAERPWVAPPGQEVTPAGQEIVVKLRMGSVLTGTLFGPDGAPFAKGYVRSVDAGRPLYSFTTREDGTFTLITDPQRSDTVTLVAQAMVETVLYRADLADVAHGARDVVLRLEKP